MASFLKTLLLALLFCLVISYVASSRPLDDKSALLARVKLDENESSSCWDSLFELQSCTGEVVLFFLNGETYLGPNCCRAIRIIENQCWPSMLGSVGINSEEGDILLGYCDAADSDSDSGATPQSHPPSEAVIPVLNRTWTSHDIHP